MGGGHCRNVWSGGSVFTNTDRNAFSGYNFSGHSYWNPQGHHHFMNNYTTRGRSEHTNWGLGRFEGIRTVSLLPLWFSLQLVYPNIFILSSFYNFSCRNSDSYFRDFIYSTGFRLRKTSGEGMMILGGH